MSPHEPAAPSPVVVLMGVSGSGKSTVGAMLAAAWGWSFVEGDRLHPPTNVERMAAGLALDDEARRPWLDAVAEAIRAHRGAEEPLVVTCSALRRRYRDRLRAAGPVRFVLLLAPPDVIAARVAARAHEFMPSSLLEDQLATLELPGTDEPDVVVVAADGDAAATAEAVERALAG